MTESMTHAEVDHFPRGVASHEVEEVIHDFASLLYVFAHLDDHVLLQVSSATPILISDRWSLHAVRTLWSDRSRSMVRALQKLSRASRRTRLKYDLSTPWHLAERRLRDGGGTLLQRALRTHEGLEKSFATLASDVVSDEVRQYLTSLAGEERRTVRVLARLDHELCHAV